MAFFGGFAIGNPFDSDSDEQVLINDCMHSEYSSSEEEEIGAEIDVDKLPSIDTLFIGEKPTTREVTLPKISTDLSKFNSLSKIIDKSTVTYKDVGEEIPSRNYEDLSDNEREIISDKYSEILGIGSSVDSKKKLEEMGFKPARREINSKFDNIKSVSFAFKNGHEQVLRIANEFCEKDFNSLNEKEKTGFVDQMKQLHEKYVNYHEPDRIDFPLIREDKTTVVLKFENDYISDRSALKTFNEGSSILLKP